WSFSVPDDLAGRKATCKLCGAPLTVPGAGGGEAAPTAASAAAPRITMRTRRLMADAEQVRRAFDGFELMCVRPGDGEAPEVYQVDYQINGMDRGGNGQPVPRVQHTAEITLTADYPRLSPKCRMLTPIFHPNIDAATICVGDHWTAGERLADLIVRIGEMIAYQAYNIKSPLDGEAAMWADLH